MTTGQMPGVDDLRSAPLAPCPCGHGDVAAEMERQRPLLERAIAGDRGALAELYEDNVDDVYRYLRAWTADDAAAKELTGQVFHGALTWLPAIAEGEGDLAAWLMTMARDAVVQQRGAGWAAGADQVGGQSPDVLVAAAQLDDAQREVMVLRLLLGHSMAHTAHLAGYSAQVVSGLQLVACSNIWEMLSGTAVDPAPPGSQELRPRWFEGCLEGASYDPSGDPGLSDLLAVADALRQAASRQVPLPDDAFLRRLRERLLGELDGEAPERPGSANRIGRAFALARLHVGRHPWIATLVAASAIGLVFGLQATGSTGGRSACGDGPCLASTTGAAAAPQAGAAAAPPIPTLGPTTIFSTAPSSTLPPTTRGPAIAPSTVPPTTVAQTQTTQQTTTTRRRGRPSTTNPPTTATTRPPTTTSGLTTTTARLG
jgi:DNA-directed RNA polymerase specialized sigma24 family protein